MKFGQVLATGLLLLAGGCAGAGAPVISSGDRYQLSPETSDSYHLGSEDKVRLSVYNEPQLSGEFLVASDGTVSLPLVGNIAVGGKTPSEAAGEIQSKLGHGFLRNPRVGLEVITYRPIYIIGEVRLPGTYPYSPGMSAWDAVAKGGGLSPRGQRHRIYIRRAGEQAELKYNLTPNLRILPGDTVRIPERFF